MLHFGHFPGDAKVAFIRQNNARQKSLVQFNILNAASKKWTPSTKPVVSSFQKFLACSETFELVGFGLRKLRFWELKPRTALLLDLTGCV